MGVKAQAQANSLLHFLSSTSTDSTDSSSDNSSATTTPTSTSTSSSSSTTTTTSIPEDDSTTTSSTTGPVELVLEAVPVVMDYVEQLGHLVLTGSTALAACLCDLYTTITTTSAISSISSGTGTSSSVVPSMDIELLVDPCSTSGTTSGVLDYLVRALLLVGMDVVRDWTADTICTTQRTITTSTPSIIPKILGSATSTSGSTATSSSGRNGKVQMILVVGDRNWVIYRTHTLLAQYPTHPICAIVLDNSTTSSNSTSSTSMLVNDRRVSIIHVDELLQDIYKLF
jgi:hypothetical protein